MRILVLTCLLTACNTDLYDTEQLMQDNEAVNSDPQRVDADDAPVRTDDASLDDVRKAYEERDREVYMTNLDAYLDRIASRVEQWRGVVEARDMEQDEALRTELKSLEEGLSEARATAEELDEASDAQWQGVAEEVNGALEAMDGQVTVYEARFVELDEAR